MNFQLFFRTRHKYDAHTGGLSVRAVLTSGAQVVHCVAKIDAGASVCFFQRELADVLELDLESGHPVYLSTLTGSLPAFGHELTLQTFHLAFLTTVYFAASYGLKRNLLGRTGWLQQVRLGIVDYDEAIYLSAYNDTDES